ncbi:DUF1178 family protein [Microvirga sp. W0021]|uniref:DUF1178 family protein n=1 Tax=Hohaiivirga grylli TaxID=3133970 RepID=A0ABV0BN29_9HYPH
MIRYALACHQGHEFESWFPSSASYEEQRSKKLVSCPLCNSLKIEKQIMAPQVARTDKDKTTQASPKQSIGLLSEKEQQIRETLRALRRHVVENAEDVGERFPEEARRIHEGNVEKRSIYGRATLKETKELLDEGIDIMPLPDIPDDKN